MSLAGRMAWYQVWVAACFLFLMSVTYPLWLPLGCPGATEAFPRVPLFGVIAEVWRGQWGPSAWLLVVAGEWLGLIAVSLGAAVWGGNSVSQALPCLKGQDLAKGDRWSEIGRLLFLVGLPVLWLANQHNLQPWAYLAWWVALVGWPLETPRAGLTHRSACFARWQWVTVSVYFFSAISKFDRSFLETLGPQFVQVLTDGVGVAPSPSMCVTLAWCFPLGELALALGLGVSLITGQFRRSFVVLSWVMHLTLLAILGPWGLDHHAGVLVWNLFFLGQGYLLFWPLGQADTLAGQTTSDSAEAATPTHESLGSLAMATHVGSPVRVGGGGGREAIARCGFGVVLLFPVLQLFDACDHWLAWELYAPRGSRVQVFVATPVLDQEGPWSNYIQVESSADEGPFWHEIRLDQWSLDVLQAPIYPEDRFQLGVARAIAERLEDPSQLKAVWYGTADRWSGRREKAAWQGRQALTAASDRFLFGSDGMWKTPPGQPER